MPNAVNITDDEIRGMVSALDVAGTAASLAAAKKLVNQALVDYLRGQISEAAIKGQPALYEAIRGQLTGPPNPRSIAAAQALAERQSETLAKGLVESQLNTMGETIAKGIEAGKHPHEIARSLDMVTGLDKNRAARMDKYTKFLDSRDPALSKAEWERRYESRFQKELADRKRTIAHNEQRTATSEGNKLLAEERGVKWQAWMTVGDDRVSEECEANEAQGWIEFGEVFAGGVSQPPQHVNCRCTVAYRTAPPNDAAEARATRRAEKTSTAKATPEEVAA